MAQPTRKEKHPMRISRPVSDTDEVVEGRCMEVVADHARIITESFAREGREDEERVDTSSLWEGIEWMK
jgi:hypothetical protein